jgi:NhaP-type Na+/H+ or K+/H+ antiporter
MAESQHALLTFHSELAFLVRSFFFVLIGAVAQLGVFREHPLMAWTLGSLFLARWLAIQSSRWAWQGIQAHSRELIFWVMPRGLITVWPLRWCGSGVVGWRSFPDWPSRSFDD